MEDVVVIYLLVSFGMLCLWGIIETVRSRRESLRRLDKPPTSGVTCDGEDVTVDPSLAEGTVRISAEFLRSYGISSCVEGVMYRPDLESQNLVLLDFLLRRQGYGENRALPVMIVGDDSLKWSHIAMSAKDAKRLRLKRWIVVSVDFAIRSRPHGGDGDAVAGNVSYTLYQSPPGVPQRGPQQQLVRHVTRELPRPQTPASQILALGLILAIMGIGIVVWAFDQADDPVDWGDDLPDRSYVFWAMEVVGGLEAAAGGVIAIYGSVRLLQGPRPQQIPKYYCPYCGAEAPPETLNCGVCGLRYQQ